MGILFRACAIRRVPAPSHHGQRRQHRCGHHYNIYIYIYIYTHILIYTYTHTSLSLYIYIYIYIYIVNAVLGLGCIQICVISQKCCFSTCSKSVKKEYFGSDPISVDPISPQPRSARSAPSTLSAQLAAEHRAERTLIMRVCPASDLLWYASVHFYRVTVSWFASCQSHASFEGNRTESMPIQALQNYTNRARGLNRGIVRCQSTSLKALGMTCKPLSDMS